MTALDPAPRTAATSDAGMVVESAERRRQRISTGVLIGVVGVLLLVALGSTSGSARFALSDAFDEVRATGYAVSLAERDSDSAGIACPVFGVGQRLVGAL